MEVIPGIKLGDVVSFSVFENVKAVLPTKFDNVKVVGSLDADSAKALIDPYTLHRNIYPMLAQGTAPDDPTQYYYIKVKLPNGQFTAVGIPWINPTTIEQRDSSTAVVRIQNISSTDLTRLRNHIAAAGWTLVDAKMV
ncbi:MAG: hypothetical protein CMO01_07510 [Thalassobius sp.]|nr:hypothetical protein [Thalassovita sp.]|tara:strand:+ start:78534 stop:78947 length:414 start_codon:yes stop_codon:yes gene_type:complete